MDPHKLVMNGEMMAQALVHEARMKNVSYSDLIQIVTVAQRLLKATYPGEATEVFDLVQTADAAFDAVVLPPPMHN